MLRTVFTPDVMKDVLLHVDQPLRKSLVDLTGRTAVTFPGWGYYACKSLRNALRSPDISRWNFSYGKDFNKMAKIDYNILAETLTKNRVGIETQFLRSYSFLRALVKAGAVQFCWPSSLHEGVIPASDAVSEDEGCPTVEEEVMEDFIKLFKMLQDPKYPIEWT